MVKVGDIYITIDSDELVKITAVNDTFIEYIYEGSRIDAKLYSEWFRQYFIPATELIMALT